MKVRINKQKVTDTIADIVVISAVLTFLWNLILPVTIGVSTISYWAGLGIVAHIYGVWQLLKPAVEEATEANATVMQMIPINLLSNEKTA